jgi:lysophospholipase L1-like esterase
MKKFNIFYIAAFLVVFSWSCSQDGVLEKDPRPAALCPDQGSEGPFSTGTADFTKMVSVGNSLTAGYMHGTLYTDGQNNSFPKILHAQAKIASPAIGDFNQPNINAEVGCFNPAAGCTAGRLRLVGSGISPITPGNAITAFEGDKAALNNFGVPGVTLGTALIPETGNFGNMAHPAFNPYYARFASNPGTSTLIGDAAAAMANGGTFFTFWLGNNDVLGYATGGAANPAILTSVEDFQTRFNAALGAMLAAAPEAKGAVANIPYVTAIPYFTFINPLRISVPLDRREELEAGINQLNAAIAGWNGGVNANTNLTPEQKAALIRPLLSTNFDVYPVIIADPTLSDAEIPTGQGPFVIPKIRNVTAADGILLVLPAQTALGQAVGISPLTPLHPEDHNHLYLTKAEQDEIKERIDAFNAIIATGVTNNSSRLVLVDVNARFNQFVGIGVEFKNCVTLTPSFAPPTGAFSLDGVHPNKRGSAFMANIFIEAINAKFGATIPRANYALYGATELPVNP